MDPETSQAAVKNNLRNSIKKEFSLHFREPHHQMGLHHILKDCWECSHEEKMSLY